MIPDRSVQAYEQDYFQRVRRRTFAIQAMAPIALLVVAVMDAWLTGTAVFTGARGWALCAGMVALGALMAVLARITTLHTHGWVTIVLLCASELALAFIVTPSERSLQWVMPVMLVIPVAAAPFWVRRRKAVASCVLCYACAAVGLVRTQPDPAAIAEFAGWAGLFTATSLAVFASIDRLRRSAFAFQVALDQEAKHDALTGLLSRRRFLLLGEAATRDAEQRDMAVSLCFVDLDRFKEVNDLRGHAVGDLALARVAETMLERVPPDALVARMGGEEFVLLLPGFDAAAARIFADALRLAVRAQDMGGFAVSISAGIAQHRMDDALSHTLQRADRAMLDAKQAGRDRVIVAT